MQFIINNSPHCSNADILVPHHYSQCDMTITSHHVFDLVDEISCDDCVCLAWSRIINQTVVVCTKTGNIFLNCLVGRTVLTVHGQNPTMNSGRFNTFSYQKLDNASLFLNRRILKT